MNSKLKEIIDAHFLDIEMNDEAQALHDELSADLNERFEDLLTEGVREEDAIEMIRADLADFHAQCVRMKPNHVYLSFALYCLLLLYRTWAQITIAFWKYL